MLRATSRAWLLLLSTAPCTIRVIHFSDMFPPAAAVGRPAGGNIKKHAAPWAGASGHATSPCACNTLYLLGLLFSAGSAISHAVSEGENPVS